MKTIMHCVSVLAIAVAAAAPAGEPEFKTELRKADDRVEIAVTNGTAVIGVTSVSGIGGARITLADGDWPTNVLIRINIRGLEGFEIGNSRTNLSGSLKIPDGMKISRESNSVWIAVPPDLLGSDSRLLRFSWIDFYR